MCWALCAVPLGIAVWFVQGFSLVMPLFDHWTLLPILARLSSGTVRLSDLFGPHNGLHVAPFTKLILAALATFTGWSFRAEIFAGFALATYTAWMLHRAFEESLPGPEHRAVRALVALLSMGLLFSPAQDWIWTWSIGFFHYFENAGIATVVWALAKRKPRIGFAVLGCTLATFNRFEGMFTWIAFLPALLLAIQRVERKAIAWIGWGVAGSLSIGICAALIIHARPAELAGVHTAASSKLIAPFEMALSLVGMSAGFFTESHGPAALGGAAFLPAGLLVLLLFLATASMLVRARGSRSTAMPFLCLGGFGLAFAIATAFARHEGVASNSNAVSLLRCYLSSYSATASLVAVATVHVVALFFAEHPLPGAVRSDVLRRGAAVAGIGILCLDYVHAFPRLIARRADGQWDHYCVELAPYFAARSTCFMPAGGAAALARSGFRKEAEGVTFVPGAPPLGRVDLVGTATEPFSGSEVPALAGSADFADASEGTVLLAFGDDRRFVGQASQVVSDTGRIEWVAMVPWAFVDADRRPLHAWAYDRKGHVFRRLAGGGRPRRGAAGVR